MKKPKGLQKALGKQQQQQARRKRQEAHEKRQEELLKQQNKPKPKSGSAPSSSKSKGKGKAEAETTDGPSTADGVAVKRAPKYSPYHDGQTVLFVGEGDFSFAVSWASKYPRSAKQSVATSYDSREVGSSKYPDLAGNVERVRDTDSLGSGRDHEAEDRPSADRLLMECAPESSRLAV